MGEPDGIADGAPPVPRPAPPQGRGPGRPLGSGPGAGPVPAYVPAPQGGGVPAGTTRPNGTGAPDESAQVRIPAPHGTVQPPAGDPVTGPGPDAAAAPETAGDTPGPAGSGQPCAGPEPLGVALTATGNADVDAAVDRLRDADELPVHAHIEVYEDAHRGLRDALAALDENRG
jgi:hypothetical protein